MLIERIISLQSVFVNRSCKIFLLFYPGIAWDASQLPPVTYIIHNMYLMEKTPKNQTPTPEKPEP